MSFNNSTSSRSNRTNTNSSTIPGVADSDYYGILGVKSDATPEEIKKAYKRMALKSHPDHGGDAEIFKLVSHAYSVLSDPEKRRIYDTYGEEGITNGVGEDDYDSFDPFSVFGNFFNGGFSPMGFDDFDIFGDGRPSKRSSKRSNRHKKTDDIVEELQCSLEDDYIGATKKVQFRHTIVCKECNGRGSANKAAIQCKRCNGTGIQVTTIRRGFMTQQTQTTCPVCHGSGKYISPKNCCKSCHGHGIINEVKTVDVTIPKGSQNGDTICLEGIGNEEIGIKPGDVIFVIQEAPDQVFKRKDSTLLTTITISLSEALCGFSSYIETPDHRKIHFSSPKGTPQTVKVIEGEGMPCKDGGKGDLIIRFKIQFPSSISQADITNIANALHYKKQDQKCEDICEEVVLKDVDMSKYAHLRKQSFSSDHHSTTNEDGCEYYTEDKDANECCVY